MKHKSLNYTDLIEHIFGRDDVFPSRSEVSRMVRVVPKVLHTLHTGVKSHWAPNSLRDEEIIMMRYTGSTFKSIGDVYGITTARIRQIVVQQIRRLRHPTRIKILKTAAREQRR